MAVSKELHQQLTKDLPQFEEAAQQFFNKEMSALDFKHVSGNFGSYAERGHESAMVRLRLTGGTLREDQYAFLRDMIAKHNIQFVHLTTSQSLQLHHLKEAAPIVDIMQEAAAHDIYTRGGGGDNPRNVGASPLRGVATNEYFDVSPYVDAIATYALSMIGTWNLPRKYKIAVSGTSENDVHATFRDLGFQARPDGKFDVYGAGGLGPNPRMGLLMAEGVEPSDVLYYVRAMADTFTELGNYKNRGRARSRYMPVDAGEETFRATFQKHLEAAKQDASLALHVEATPVTKQGAGALDIASLSAADAARVVPQKQENLYSVYYHPVGGSPSVDTWMQLLDALIEMKGTEMRLTMDESCYIINLTAEEAKRVLALTADSAKNLAETSVSCVGATVCQIGVQNSNGLLHAILDAVRPHNFADGVLPKFHVSGCPSSCGTHQIGTIGFHGTVKLVDKHPEPAFKITLGGTDRLGHENFGEELGVIVAAQIPALFVELGEAVTAANMTFDTYLKEHEAELRAIIAKYA